METVTTKLLSSLIEEAMKNGVSKEVEIDDSQIAYLRMLVSRYNNKNGTEIRARKVSGVNWVISAPFDRFIDQERWKRSFDIIQRVLMNPDEPITEADLGRVQTDLHTIIGLCKERLDKAKGTHDLLK